MAEETKSTIAAPIVVTVDHRFVRANGSTLCVTKSEDLSETKEFATRPAVVRRAFGVTLNQGNYESSRIDVSVEVPCYLEDLERADEFARDFCEQRLRAEVMLIKPEKKSAAGPF
jgi:hypothetical protein